MEADREEPERGKGAFLTKKKRRPTKRGSPTKTNSKKFWKQEKEKEQGTPQGKERVKLLILKRPTKTY